MNLLKRIICWFKEHKPSWEGMVWVSDDGCMWQLTDCTYCKKQFMAKIYEIKKVE